MKILAQKLTIDNLKRDIEKTKNKLSKTPITENFGQNEYRKLRDKYAGLMVDNYAEYNQLLYRFNDWCMEHC